MNRLTIGTLIAISLGAAGMARSAGNPSEIVTNPAPAVSAAMTLVSSFDDGSGVRYNWLVQGKVKPSYRGLGATVHLVCQRFSDLVNSANPPLVFPGSRLDNSTVDGCGNFAFNAETAGAPQLDPSYFCYFVAHLPEGSPAAPQSCNGKAVTVDTSVPDPTGIAPCSGGLCPNAS